MKSKYPSQFFNAVNAEKQNSEFIENWRIFKAFLVSPRGESQVLKICLPLDESINPLVSEKDDSCEERIKQYTMKTDQHVVQLMPGEQHKFVGGQNALNSPAGQHQFGPEGNKNPQSLGGKYDKNNFNFKQQGAEQKYEAQVIPTQSHNVTIASNIENRNLKSNGNEYLMNKLMYLQSQVNMLYNEIQSNNQVKSRDLEQRFLKNYQR